MNHQEIEQLIASSVVKKQSDGMSDHDRLIRMHAHMEIHFGNGQEGMCAKHDTRLTTVERWMYRISGMGMVLGVTIGYLISTIGG